MKNNQNGFASILLVLFVLFFVGGGVYFYTKQKSEVKVEDLNSVDVLQSTSTVATTSEVKTTNKKALSQLESFKKQPVKILSIKDLGNGRWSVEADVLTYNPDWVSYSNIVPMYLNQNSKIRNLIISKNTKFIELCNTIEIINESLEYGNEIIIDMDIEGDQIIYIYNNHYCAS